MSDLMLPILFLLLPVAAFSGWYWGTKHTLKSQQQRASTFSANYLQGINYVLNEQPDRAVDVFLGLLDVDVQSNVNVNHNVAEIHLMLGNLFRRRGEVDKAIKIHQSLLNKSSKPNLPQDYVNLLKLELAKDYIHVGLIDRAETILFELIDHEREVAASLTLLGSIYEESKDWLKAADIYSKLQQLVNSTPQATLDTKNLYFTHDACVSDTCNTHSKTKTSNKYSHKMAHFFCELAQNLLQKHNLPDAKHCITRALALDKNCIRGYMLLAECHIAETNYQAALDLLRTIVREADTKYVGVNHYFFEIIPRVVFCYNQVGLDPNQFWQELLAQHSKDTGVILAYTSYLQETQTIVAALEYLTKALKTQYSLLGLSKAIELNLLLAAEKFKHGIDIAKVLQRQYNYKCLSCGLTAKLLEWRCPSCKRWGTFRIAALFDLA
jgi:lipopolysaccharide biosynthesis regulator YciM